MTLGQWLHEAHTRLEEAGVESARLEAQALAAFACGRDRAWLLAHPEENAPRGILETLLQRRLLREPLAYIVGSREFFGRSFLVNRSVLVPRQETETLVEAALERMPEGDPMEVLDVGTGSGCLAVTLALERPQARVTALDLSEEALQVARANAERLGAKLRFLPSDLFSELGEADFDRIVTNPPYVRPGEPLPPEVGLWEPAAALFAGSSGLEFFERLAELAPKRLRPEGLLLTEVGDGQSEAAAQTFSAAGWRVLERRKDLLGHERVLVLALPS
jgi:release factor glutamine methyltransferase